MVDTLETSRDYRVIIPLTFLQISDLYTVPTRFYESLKDKNRMCELCTFSQIRSHIVKERYYCRSYIDMVGIYNTYNQKLVLGRMHIFHIRRFCY